MEEKQRAVQEAEEIRRMVRRIYKVLDRSAGDRAKQGGMTVPQIRVIEVLYHHPGASLKEISGELEMAHSTISSVMDRLEALNCIVRRQDEQDKRITRHYLQDHVIHYIENQMPQDLSTPIADALAEASEEDRETIRRGLSLLLKLLNA